MSRVVDGVVDGMIAGDDRDHSKEGLVLCVFKSQSFVVRANKRETMAKLSLSIDNNGSPFHSRMSFFFYGFSQGARLAPFPIT